MSEKQLAQLLLAPLRYRGDGACQKLQICDIATRLNEANDDHAKRHCLVQELYASDKLHMLRQNEKIFQTLREHTITFLPSVRFKKGKYNLLKGAKRATPDRLPGYADRILYSPDLSPIEYDLETDNYFSSDHRPVTLKLLPQLRWLPRTTAMLALTGNSS